MLRHSQIHMLHLHSIWVNHRAHARADALQLGNTMFDLALLAAIPTLLTKKHQRALCVRQILLHTAIWHIFGGLNMQIIVRCKPRLIDHFFDMPDPFGQWPQLLEVLSEPVKHVLQAPPICEQRWVSRQIAYHSVAFKQVVIFHG